MGRSPKPLEVDFELPRGGVLDLRGARTRAVFRRRLNRRGRRVGDFGRGAGVGAGVAVASGPAERVLAIQSWILPRGGRQTIGGDRARRWTSTQQPPDMLGSPPKGTRPKAPSETNATTLSGPPSLASLLLPLLLPLTLLNCNTRNQTLRPKDQETSQAFGALFSLMCTRSVTRIPLFIRDPRVFIHLNYTFSFPDKWLYTLFKGIIVTSYGSPACLRTVKPL
jgi:hypothetical protein